MQTAGSLGLQQEKLGVETQEEQKKREFEAALANQRAGLENRKSDADSSRANRKDIGSMLIEGAKVASLFNKRGMVRIYAEGGKVDKPMPKAKIIAAHAAAKKNVKAFKKEYGKEEGKDIAYATMMKMAKENKLADGGKLKKDDPSTYITEDGKETRRGLWANVHMKREREERQNMADGGEMNAAMGKLAKMDNEKNDTIPAMLSPGEIVIPRSIVNAPNAPMAAAKFVQALLENKDKKDAKMLALKAALGKK
jgi:hypothetical protein